MSFETVNLKELVGSEVRARVENLLDPQVGRELRELLVQRGVLVFKKLGLTDEQQVKLAGYVDALRDEGEKNIFKISLEKKASAPAGEKKKGAPANYLKGSFLWHMDGTHDDVPVFGCLLTGIKLSSTGGQTEFANSYAAYEALSPAQAIMSRAQYTFSGIKTEIEKQET